MKSMKAFSDVDAYIADFPKETQKLLKQLRATITKNVPKDAEETISYGIPTYKYYGNLIHFGGFKKHVGLFPGPGAVKKFAKELKGYVTSKGTIQFPLDAPLPLGLVADIAKFRVKVAEEDALAKAAKSTKK